MLVKEFSSRHAFTVKRLPLLARFYCKAYHSPGRMWQLRARRVMFSIFYAWCRRSRGEFDYDRLGRRTTIGFNARNLQFQALYSPFCKNGYEPDVAMLLDALLPEGGTFFDIGSNWGYFSLYAAGNHKRLTVHAFEPMPGTFRDLTDCVEQAGIADVVTCHRVALSSADGEASIQIPDGLHSGQAMVSADGGTTRVATRRLDAMNLPPPDFIKIDVEGHEIEVLRGGVETLQARHPFIVFENKPFDRSPEKTLEPLFFLSGIGYRLYVPAILRREVPPRYYMPAGGHLVNQGDLLALMPLEAEARLLWHSDLNVFACHESRLSQLAAVFKT